MIKAKIIDNLKVALEKMGVKEEIVLDRPANASFGDYASSVALKLTKILKKNPVTIAGEIVKSIPQDKLIKKIEVIKPGFINFWISDLYLFSFLEDTAKDKISFEKHHLGPAKKVIVEFAHPNTHKLFHIGHLRNISTGEAIVQILEAAGNKVIRANYQGDVGLHIAKCLYGIKNSKLNIKDLKTLHEKIKLLGKMYAEGNKAYESDKKAKKEIININRMIYEQDPKILPLWKETRQWSLNYFEEIYKRVNSYFDRLYFESEMAKRGVEVVKDAIKKGILKKSQGAVVFDGKKYGLHTRVFINNEGFPTYEGKELALAEKEFSDFGEIDKCIHVVGPEQSSFFKVTFKVEELLSPEKYKNKQHHLIYGWVKLKHGKMSSRQGNVIEGPWLVDEVKKRIKNKFNTAQEIAEILAIASIKYSFLKATIQNEIAFDFDESIAVDGNSAPYLIYTYVRCRSVLKKSQISNVKSPSFVPLSGTSKGKQIQISNPEILSIDEQNLLRQIFIFTEIVNKAASGFSPNLIANYLYDLASQYNLFYQKCPILKAEKEKKEFRILITKATANIIKKGLYLLGINTVEKM